MEKQSGLPEWVFQEWEFGPFRPRNRIFQGAMSRCQCTPCGSATSLTQEFFSQRSKFAGLAFTGSMYVEPLGHTYKNECGMLSEVHSQSWKPIIETVHYNGGYIFAQLFHGGRAMHHKPVDFNCSGVSPSGTFEESSLSYFPGEQVPNHLPSREMTLEEIRGLVDSFRKSAELCYKAGFDGIELNAANGYLIDNFIRSSSNWRSDSYGGSVENRCRLALEVIDQFRSVFGSDRVGIKLSPATRFNNMYDDDPLSTYNYLLDQLSLRNILYVQFTEPEPIERIGSEYWGGHQIPNSAQVFRPRFQGFFITNGYMTVEEAGLRLEGGLADAVAFSTRFIANPDLPRRLQYSFPLTQPNEDYFYWGGATGYIDYPEYSVGY